MTATFDPDRYLSMPAERMGEYLAAVEAAREAHPEIEVLVGCEMDWLGDDEDRVITAEDVAPFQLILGSVHLVDRWPFDDPAQRGRWDEVGADPIWRRYFEVWCEAVSSDAPFHVMSHPDLAKKFGFYPSFDPQPLYEQAAEACAAAGRMVEVNTSGSYYACKEMFPAPALLAAFCRAGVPCTVGTDAHDSRRRPSGHRYRVTWDRKSSSNTSEGAAPWLQRRRTRRIPRVGKVWRAVRRGCFPSLSRRSPPARSSARCWPSSRLPTPSRGIAPACRWAIRRA